MTRYTAGFLLVVASVMVLSARSCLIDGEAIVSDEAGLAVFDLLELDGQDLRGLPIEQRKRTLGRAGGQAEVRYRA
jgi:ATP-dependent DNA ligase